METDIEAYKPWEWDALLRPNWRFLDARRLATGEEPVWSAGDPAIVDCAEYLRATGISEAAPRAKKCWSAIRAAHALAQEDSPRRWEVEARLLAGQSAAEIRAKCGLPPAVVNWYERLFFNVRPRLGARMWITNIVIGPGIHRGFQDHEVGRLWAAFGYHGGHIVLDAFVGAFRAAWRPGEPATVSIYLRPDAGIDPRIQANVASLVLPHFGPAGEVWIKVHLQLMKASAAREGQRAVLWERARAWLIQCARARLTGKPLPKQRSLPKASDVTNRSPKSADRLEGDNREAAERQDSAGK